MTDRKAPSRAALLTAAAVVAACSGTPAQGQEAPSPPGGNPIITDRFTADPAPLVHDGRVYLYVGHDEAGPDQMFNITEWLVYSSDDMRNWEEHGPVMKPTDFHWAIRDAWASEVEEKDGKFYLYTTVEHDETDPGKAIGVAVSDSPTGPFVDARGSALVSNSMTKQAAHSWDDIDPTVFQDDDGTAWLYWGNQILYYAKLEDNMIELDGPITAIGIAPYEEGPWIHKHEDTYYLTYAAIDRSVSEDEQIHYATAPSVTGPWTPQGMLTGSGENSFTIHPGTVEFEGQWYLFYHDAGLTVDGVEGGLGRRAVRAEYLYHEPDGSLRPVEQTDEGLSLPPAD
ncbi:glycoside hydrolase family 43 protein [Parvularcula oceani]|uniref:glycoside hydrolase family 43 protein n=1 Tax=Parvularcula oceani TaxID=1247963 RepID=UPI0004E18E1A|nr:glycoside hydrolase family 43 protein [Parvularcula oceani]